MVVSRILVSHFGMAAERAPEHTGKGRDGLSSEPMLLCPHRTLTGSPQLLEAWSPTSGREQCERCRAVPETDPRDRVAQFPLICKPHVRTMLESSLLKFNLVEQVCK